MTTKHNWHGGLRKPIALVLVVLVAEVSVVAAAASAQGVDVTPTTLVSNHHQMDTGDGFLTHRGTVFQGFTTGGNPAGYELTDVSVVLLEPPPDPPDTEDVHEMTGLHSRAVFKQAAPQYRIEIWTEKGINIKMPDEVLYTLITPASVPLGEQVAFTAPAEAALAPNTGYYVRIVGATQVAWDMDRQVDSGAAPGWSLDQGLMHQSEGANTWARYVPNAVITIRGTALSTPVE